jgi:6,7-dimethyl-8-ribityllumazine synthase
MRRLIEGNLDGTGLRVAIVVSRFNGQITERLLAAAEDCLERHGCGSESRTVVRVPGAWELPFAVQRVVSAGEHDAVVALGALIRGDTPHFDVIAHEVARGLGQIARDGGVPVSFGVLTTNTVEQAIDRSGAKSGNKGWEAALAAVECATLARRLEHERARTVGDA